MDVGAQPGRQILAPGRLHVQAAAGAEHRDEHLGLPDLTRFGIGDRHRVARKIDEQALTGGVLQAHHHVLPRQPAAVMGAELGVAPALGVNGLVFEMQQLQGDVLAALVLAVHLQPVGFRPP